MTTDAPANYVWTKLATKGAVGARAGHSLAFSNAKNLIYLFGGASAAGGGARRSPRGVGPPLTSPPAPSAELCVFDIGSDTVVIVVIVVVAFVVHRRCSSSSLLTDPCQAPARGARRPAFARWSVSIGDGGGGGGGGGDCCGAGAKTKLKRRVVSAVGIASRGAARAHKRMSVFCARASYLSRSSFVVANESHVFIRCRACAVAFGVLFSLSFFFVLCDRRANRTCVARRSQACRKVLVYVARVWSVARACRW